jgi:glycosyltransferase involved in cell wall biosynthesis
MRILQISNKFPYPPKDGGAIATFSLTRDFSTLNHAVTVLSINTPKHYFDLKDLPKNVNQIAEFHTVYVDTSVSVLEGMYNLLVSSKPYIAVRFISKKFRNYLSYLLKNNEYDVIQLEGLFVCPYLPVIRLYSKALVAFRAHNIEHEIWQRTAKREKNIFKKLYFKILASRLKEFEISYLNTYDVLLPITSRDAKHFSNLGNFKPVHVTPTGVKIDKPPEPQSVETLSMFHLGGLDWKPNQEGLIWFVQEVLPKVVRKYPEAKFYIGGRNSPEWLGKKLEHPNVLYLGEITDASNFIKSKAVMIVPLFAGSGMRIKIVEGMAHGKTIITTSIGEEGIGAKHKKNILIADNENEFFSNIDMCFSRPELLTEIGNNAAEFSMKHFDNKNITQGLISFYENQIK